MDSNTHFFEISNLTPYHAGEFTIKDPIPKKKANGNFTGYKLRRSNPEAEKI